MSTADSNERTFPYISGDRIRLKTWTPNRWISVGGYGQVYFIGTFEDGTEGPYFKDARMAYNDEWELYAPSPELTTGYAQFDENGAIVPLARFSTEPDPSRYGQIIHGHTIWKCRITPEIRIYP